LGLNPLRCTKCRDVCEPEAIDYDEQDKIVTEKVGAIVVATGYELYAKEYLAEYGYGLIPDVIDGLQLERLLSASGPTSGEVKRPSDGKVPKNIVFIACVGSRDPENHLPYCSKICCMYSAKHALLLKHQIPDANVYVFYMDIRAGGKDYEEFVQNIIEHERIVYIRGRISRIFQDKDKVQVCGADTLQGRQVKIAADIKQGKFHDLRRTCLSNLFFHGLSEYDVMKVAGHSSFETTHNFYLAVRSISKLL